MCDSNREREREVPSVLSVCACICALFPLLCRLLLVIRQAPAPLNQGKFIEITRALARFHLLSVRPDQCHLSLISHQIEHNVHSLLLPLLLKTSIVAEIGKSRGRFLVLSMFCFIRHTLYPSHA